MSRAPARHLLPALLLLGSWACAGKDQVTIFATGRTQGRIGAVDDGGGRTGGFAVFKKLYDSEPGPKLAVDTGNWFSAVPEGWLTRGRSTLDCLNAVPYAAAAAGLEDLALTPAEFQKLAAGSAVPILASNLYLKSNKKPPFLHSWRVVQAGGRKIGFFSAVRPSPKKANRPRHLQHYRLEKETYETEKAMKALKDAGASVIVMLMSVNPKEEAGEEFFREFVSKVSRVDLIITDDPQVRKPFRAGRAWVAGAGLEMREAARLTLDLDKATGRLTGVKWKAVELRAEKYGQDQAMLKIVTRHKAAAAAHMGRRIGSLAAPLPLRDGVETPAADFAADCMRRWARTNAAIIPLSEPAAGFSSGTVTVGDLRRAFPLDSSVVFVKMRGDDLERVMASMPPSDITVSGLRLFLKDGVFERAESENGPLAAGHIYRLAVPDSMTGDREHSVLANAMEFANSRRSLREVVSWCFSRQNSIPRPEGRRIVRGN